MDIRVDIGRIRKDIEALAEFGRDPKGGISRPSFSRGALECLRRIKEEKLPLARALEIVSFTDEEGNLVGDFLGSRAYLGLLNGDPLRRETTQFGRPLAEVLDGTGFTVEGGLSAQ